MANETSKQAIRVDNETWELFKKTIPPGATAGEYFQILLTNYLTKNNPGTNDSTAINEILKSSQQEIIEIKEYVSLIVKGMTSLPSDEKTMKKITFSPSRFEPLIKEKLEGDK